MDGLSAFLDAYGLAAIFVVMLLKAAGVPIPIPGDVILLAAAARAAQGKLALGPAFVVILLALILGGLGQFGLARGPGRGFLYRFGRYLGLTQARLDLAAAAVQRRGLLGIAVAIFTPGVRVATVAACGLAGVPLRVFVPALAFGSAADLGVHFAIGYLGGSLAFGLFDALPVSTIVIGVIAVLVVGFLVWLLIQRRRRPGASVAEVTAAAAGAWHEATCPACLVLGSSRLAQPAHQRHPASAA